MTKSIKPINQSLGKSASIGLFTGFQYAAALLSFGTGFFTSFIFGVGLVWSILCGFWAAATVLILSGKKPYLFWSRIFPRPPVWARGYVRYSNPLLKNKVGSKKLKKLW
ncbi:MULTISPECIES: hypothetical protein [unclassified Nostoc]|uniref:hypothetical protein n=1 Tax=unclassified Nostoc TaxID=2593658 RepID=UPI001F54B7B7|nr:MULTISPECIES: hypothetical protein [unclassified Nostoc]